MAKGTSESAAGAALREGGLFVYKPPDDARNWKPCDFMCWLHRNGGWRSLSLWVEVKAVRTGNTLPARDIRPSQIAGVAEAVKIGLPYYLLVRWGEPPKYEWSVIEVTQLSLSHGNDWAKKIGKRTDPYWWDKFGSLKQCVKEIIE